MAEELPRVHQRAHIVIGFARVGKSWLMRHKPERYNDVEFTEFNGRLYSELHAFNTPAEPDAATIEARTNLVADIMNACGRPGLIIVNNVFKIWTQLEPLGLDYKMVSPPINTIPENRPARRAEKQEWDDEVLVPARKKLELAEGQHLSDVIEQIMEEPIVQENIDDEEAAAAAAGEDEKEDDYDWRAHQTDNRLHHTNVHGWPLSFSSIILNSPYSQNEHKVGGGLFSRFPRFVKFMLPLLLLANTVLFLVLCGYVWAAAREYQDLVNADMVTRTLMVRDPKSWLENSPHYFWAFIPPRKLLKLAMPWAQRTQVSENLLQVVEAWVQAERFIRVSDPPELYSEPIRILKKFGLAT